MSKFPVVRDLMVDRERLFHNLKRVKAWVPIDGTYDLGAGRLTLQNTNKYAYTMATCMSCGCCLEACPQFNKEESPADWDDAFLGPHAINQARCSMNTPRAKSCKTTGWKRSWALGGERLRQCPRLCELVQGADESIARIGRAYTFHGLKQLFQRQVNHVLTSVPSVWLVPPASCCGTKSHLTSKIESFVTRCLQGLWAGSFMFTILLVAA